MTLTFSFITLSAAFAWWLSDLKLVSGAFRLLVSFMLSMVIHSLAFDLCVICNQPPAWSYIAIIGCSFFLLIRQLKMYGWPQLTWPRVTFASVCALGLIYYISLQFIPHSGRWGRWDARAIWSMHAAFLYHQQHWQNLFSPDISWTHADYPLMLPSLIAMLWRALGRIEALIPCGVAYSALLITSIMTYAALKKENRLAAILALGILSLTPLYAKVAAYQGADSLLGLFILTTIVLSVLSDKHPDPRLFVLTGWFCGFSGWVKNEGVVFALVFSIFFLWHQKKRGISIAYYLAGLLLPAFIIFMFKLCYAPHNDIAAGQGAETIQRVMDLSRYKITFKYFLDNATKIYPLTLVLTSIVAIKGYKRLYAYQLLALMAMLLVYFFTFILTPRDIAWHLETASDRLFIQLLPGFVFCLTYLAFAGKGAYKY